MINNIKDSILKFILIGIPIIAILAAVTCSLISNSKKSSFLLNQKGAKNPYEYKIEEMKEVDPRLVKYKEVRNNSPFSLNKYSAIAIANDNLYVAGTGKIEISGKLNNVPSTDLDSHVNRIIQIPLTPNSMSVSENGDMALCYNKKILFLDKKGEILFKVQNLPEKTLLTSIAIEGDYIYASDAGRRIILQFDKKGTLKSKISREDKAKGIHGFIVPSANFDIIPGGDSSIWAVNPGRLQIENYTSDGRLRSSWKPYANSSEGLPAPSTMLAGFSGCCNPTRIALLPNGEFVTAEKGIVRVKIYDATGKFKCVVATPYQFADDAKILDIATDSEGKIYVLDSKSKGIRVFVKKEGD